MVLAKGKHIQTQMAHSPALVSNEHVKSNTCVNKLISELVIGCYYYLRSWLYDLFWSSL